MRRVHIMGIALLGAAVVAGGAIAATAETKVSGSVGPGSRSRCATPRER